MTDSLSIDAMHDDTEPELAGLARIVNDGSLPDAHRRAAKLAYDRLLDDLDRPVGEVVEPEAALLREIYINDAVWLDGLAIVSAGEKAERLRAIADHIRDLALAPSPAIGRETDMTAVSVRDEETGAIHWQCTERDGRGEVSDEAVVTLAADTFPVGTRIEIIQPGAQP